MMIAIPPIYEENIVEFTQRKGNGVFTYLDGERRFQIIFYNVYAFDFMEFDYIRETNWQFGLELQEESLYIQQIVQAMPKEKLQNAFGGEYEKVKHYKLVIDDVGMYNIVCKDIKLGYI